MNPRSVASRRILPCRGGPAHLRGLLVLPTAVWTVLFFVLPLALLLLYSFGQINLVTFDVDFGWTPDNYRQLTSASTCTRLCGASCSRSAPPSVCLVSASRSPTSSAGSAGGTQPLLLVGVIVPFWTSFIVRTYAWVDLLAERRPGRHVLARPATCHGHSNILYTPTADRIGILYSYLPLMILPIYVSLERIDPGLFARGRRSRRHGLAAFRRVVAAAGRCPA